MTLTTADTMTAADLDRVRADTLRLLLSLAEAHELPMPARIEFWNLDTGHGPHRSLTLHLDDNRPDDVARWADAIGAVERRTRVYGNERGGWTSVQASTPTIYSPNLDWHSIDVRSTCDRRPATGQAATVTAAGIDRGAAA